MNKVKEPFLFGVAGVIGYLVDVLVTLLLAPVLGVYAARIPAFVAAATATWLVNRSVTFKAHTSKHQSLWREYVHYVSLMVFGLVVNYLVYVTAITIMKDMQYAIIISIALGSLSGMVVNFINSKKYIFNQPKK